MLQKILDFLDRWKWWLFLAFLLSGIVLIYFGER
jgi:preprotein translocase subunit SecG